MKTLFVAWKPEKSEGGWFPVGRLDADVASARYEFRYVAGAMRAVAERGFTPFDSFPDFRKGYVSGELFPFFANRLQNQNRPGFREYLDRLDLGSGADGAFDPIEVLALSEGRRATDSLEIFPKVERTASGRFAIKFFLHGWRILNPAATERIMQLTLGEELSVAVEFNNPATKHAIQLQTRDRYLIGYAPRYLIFDLAQILAGTLVSVRVSRVNSPPAPPSQRVLVIFEGTWPDGYEPMSNPDFVPLVDAMPQTETEAVAAVS